MDHNQIAVEVFDSKAEQYQARFMDVGAYSESFDLFLERLPSENASLLEVACGPGNITRYLLDRRPKLRILGTDLAPNMVALARKNNPEAEFQLMDARKIGALDRRFDGIVCGFCFPYFNKAEALQLIADAAKLLHPGGVLYLSTMEGDYLDEGKLVTSSDGTATLRLFLHEKNYLVAELERRGFRSISATCQDFVVEGEVQFVDLLIVAKKEE